MEIFDSDHDDSDRVCNDHHGKTAVLGDPNNHKNIP